MFLEIGQHTLKKQVVAKLNAGSNSHLRSLSPNPGAPLFVCTGQGTEDLLKLRR